MAGKGTFDYDDDTAESILPLLMKKQTRPTTMKDQKKSGALIFDCIIQTPQNKLYTYSTIDLDFPL